MCDVNTNSNNYGTIALILIDRRLSNNTNITDVPALTANLVA